MNFLQCDGSIHLASILKKVFTHCLLILLHTLPFLQQGFPKHDFDTVNEGVSFVDGFSTHSKMSEYAAITHLSSWQGPWLKGLRHWPSIVFWQSEVGNAEKHIMNLKHCMWHIYHKCFVVEPS